MWLRLGHPFELGFKSNPQLLFLSTVVHSQLDVKSFLATERVVAEAGAQLGHDPCH